MKSLTKASTLLSASAFLWTYSMDASAGTCADPREINSSVESLIDILKGENHNLVTATEEFIVSQ